MIKTATLRAELGLDPSKDARVLRLRDAVVTMFERSTRRLWSKRAAYSQVFRDVPPYKVELYLSLYPVLSAPTASPAIPAPVLTEWWNGSESTPETVDIADYTLDLDVGTIRRVRSSRWLHCVKAVYTGGYEDDAVPGDVMEALIVQAKFMLARMGPDKIDSSAIGFEKGTTTLLRPDVHPLFEQVASANRRFV